MRNQLLNNCSDFELFHLFKNGDDAAYIEIYHRYHKKLFLHAFKMLQDRAKSEDVIHDLFIKFFEKRESLILSTSLSSYLYTSIRNSILDIFSHNQVIEKHEQSLQDFMNKGEYITDNLIREKELKKIIEKEIAALPPKMREVFELSREAEMSYSEIAQELDIAENTVRKQISKALKQLRPKLLDYLHLFLVAMLTFFYKNF